MHLWILIQVNKNDSKLTVGCTVVEFFKWTFVDICNCTAVVRVMDMTDYETDGILWTLMALEK